MKFDIFFEKEGFEDILAKIKEKTEKINTIYKEIEEVVKNKMSEINTKMQNKEATAKDESTFATLQIINEMLARNINVLPIDIYKSDAKRFLVEGDKIRLPFSSLSGVGESAAIALANAREGGEFISIEDFQQRAKVSNSIIELLKNMGTFKNLPESSQLTLFM